MDGNGGFWHNNKIRNTRPPEKLPMQEHIDQPPSLPPSQHRSRNVKRMVFVLLLMLLGIGLYLQFCFDFPKPWDADFRSQQDLSTDEHGSAGPFPAFIAEVAHLSSGNNQLKDMPSIEAFAQQSDTAVQRLLESNDPSITRQSGHPDPSFNEKTVLSEWATSYLAAAESFTEKQDPRIQTILQLAKTGKLLSDSASTIAQHDAASNLVHLSVAALPRTIGGSDLGIDTLATILKELQELEPSSTAFTAAVKAQYRELDTLIAEVELNKKPLTGLPQQFVPPHHLSHLRFKPQMTRYAILEVDRNLIAALPAGWHSARKILNTAVTENLRSVDITYPYRFHPNSIGKASAIEHFMQFVEPLFSAMDACTELRQAVIQLALRRHYLANNKLPTELKELVPRILESVPTDPYSGKPMIWVSTQIVYSVGANELDEGCLRRQGHMTPGDGDKVHSYWWQE